MISLIKEAMLLFIIVVKLNIRSYTLTFPSPIKLTQESNGLNFTSSCSCSFSGVFIGFDASSTSFQYLFPVDTLLLLNETSGESSYSSRGVLAFG